MLKELAPESNCCLPDNFVTPEPYVTEVVKYRTTPPPYDSTPYDGELNQPVDPQLCHNQSSQRRFKSLDTSQPLVSY
jgi:hypothetical protein